ncbi:MAG: signal peptide peptidase SppA [Cyclobacteriaceae bacterium]
MAFLRNLLATLVGLTLFTFFGFIFFAGIVSALESDEIPSVKENSILYLNMGGVVVERSIEDPLAEILPNSGPRMIGLTDILKSIKYAKEDAKIKGIYMEHRYLGASYASLKEIRDALIDFQESGKFIYAYGEYVSEGDYYLGSIADSVYLHPNGSLEFNGLSANITFWKGLFDKLEVKPEIFRVGKYKSFVEPFIRKDMSDQNREQYMVLLKGIYEIFLEGIAESRKIAVDDLADMSENLRIQLPIDALENGLIDVTGYEDEVKSKLAQRIGVDEAKDINFISLGSYKKTVGSGKYSNDKIAVIVADGDIVMGGDDNTIVGERFAREIRNARESSSVKAIVLRINSPGGSLVASDLIWREVSLTKGVKPIIASMSGVAASGGYYIAMNADTIVAQPNTITGSIGIFGMMFNLENFLENKLGITHDVVKTGEHSDIYTVTRQLSDHERSIIQRGVDDGYKTFITKAAEGRGVTPEDIDEVGGGRVWTGKQALEAGLVDVLGSYQDAIELAAEAAGLETYRVRYYPQQKQLLEQLMGQMRDEVRSGVWSDAGELGAFADEIKILSGMKGLQARMPADITIQ